MNYIPIPGTRLLASVTPARHAPGWYAFVLLDENERYLHSGALDLSAYPMVTSEQVAKIAFILYEDVL